MRHLFSNMPLRLVLIISGISQVTAAVGLTAWLSIRNGQKAVSQVAGQFKEEIAERIHHEVNDWLSTTRIINDLSVKTIQRENLNLSDIRSVEKIYWDYINTFEIILGVGAGNTNGDILALFRRIENGNSTYFLEYSSPDTQGNYLSSQLNSQRQIIQSKMTNRQIDARERPWYRAAITAAGPVWTDVYTSVSELEEHSLAVNASQPVYTPDGELQGVVSVILDLGQVSQLLEKIELSPSGQVFIVEEDGNLIGSSDGQNPVLVNEKGVDRLAATQSKNHLIRESATHLNTLSAGKLAATNQSLQLDFDIEGERHFLRIKPLKVSDKLQWFIVVVTPESDFMEQIYANTRNTIWLCIAALLVAICSSILMASWVTRPLQQLNQSAKAIAKGDLKFENYRAVLAVSRMREVRELTHSFVQMVQQLNASFAELKTSEYNFRSIAANVPGAIFRYILYPDGTDAVLYMSPGCYQLWEIEAFAVEQDASVLWAMIEVEDLPAVRASMWASAQTLETWFHEWRITTPSGQCKWLQGIGSPTHQADGAVLWHTVISDVSDRKQAEIQLQDLTNRLELAVRSARMGIWDWDIISDRVIWDDRMYELYGRTPEDFSEAHNAWEAGVHPEDQIACRRVIQQALSGDKEFNAEFRVLWPDGTSRHIEAHAMVQRDAEGYPLRMIGVNWDITDRKQAEEQLVYRAVHDALTDLPNRTLLTSRLELAIQRVQQSNAYHFAVLFLDLDQFKLVNDSLGHLIGDRLLLSVAQRLQRIIRPPDLAARLGGDEFVILLEHLPNIEAVIQIAERLLSEFDSAIVIDNNSVFITTSIGIVWGTDDYIEATNLLRDADIALYRAKAKGRGRYEIFDIEMHTQAMKRMMLEHDLRTAIYQQEFITYYQPIVDLNTQQLIGFEALIRWQHPMQGLISPGNFISVAEETGLVTSITQWILRSACQQVATWQQQFPDGENLKVSINISGQDLRQITLIEIIKETLRETQLPATSLTLEITESMLIENIEFTIDLLTQLRDLGVGISIDDFGTGYSSLSYLYNLPADYLKIDRSFVGKMHPSNKNFKIVNAVVSLSDQLQLVAIAEGVETAEQLEWLKELGCELGQGYFLSHPLTSDAAASMLSLENISDC